MRARFRFAVLADSHFRVEGSPDHQRAYPSDPTHNERNRRAVALVREAAPDLVIHLGDVPHPVPGLAAHVEALAVARRTYEALGAVPLHVVPGNHDVGDKPRLWSNAPGIGGRAHQVFAEHWGPPWRGFDHEGVHFVLIDTPILGSGLPLEAEQWAWLEADLARASSEGRRVFAFVHYPPYLLHPDEAEHYDNLAVPARRRLLDLLRGAGTEALFAGHVHNFFWDRRGGMQTWVLPSTAFVRPEYAELASVPPLLEAGRGDTDKLGFLVVHVDEDGHRVEVVRSAGQPHPRRHRALRPGAGPAPRCPLGVELRHDWAWPREIPYGNLDEFGRKRARNDYPLLAMWDLGIDTVRVPAADLADEALRERMEALASRGTRFLLFSAGLPDQDTAAAILAHAGLAEAWEIVVPRPKLAEAVGRLEGMGAIPPVVLSVVGAPEATEGAYFSHFPEHGFEPGDPDAARHGASPAVSGVMYRIGGAEPFDAVAAAAAQAGAIGRRAWCRVVLPRGTEGAPGAGDEAVAATVAEALLAVAARGVPGLVDTFVDHDRGYYPRHGLLDRRCAPRTAALVVRTLGRLLGGERPEVRDVSDGARRAFEVLGLGTVVCRTTAPASGPVVDLRHGAWAASAAPGVPYLVPEP